MVPARSDRRHGYFDGDEASPPRSSIRSDLYSPEALAIAGHKPAENPRPPPLIISVLSSLLERVVARNERLSPPLPSPPPCSQQRSAGAFCGIRVPSISIEDYLERIFRYAHCSPSCFVVAYAYIDRLVRQQPELRINSLNVHRILISSILLSAKFLDDIYYDNAYYAQIGGITTREMNKLELGFLERLNFRLHVTVSVFESYCSHLEREVAMGGGYRLERTLKSICALDGAHHHHQSEESLALAVLGSGS